MTSAGPLSNFSESDWVAGGGVVGPPPRSFRRRGTDGEIEAADDVDEKPCFQDEPFRIREVIIFATSS